MIYSVGYLITISQLQNLKNHIPSNEMKR